MELNVKLDPLAYLPERAHPTDAGLDLRTPHDVLVMPGVGAVVDTDAGWPMWDLTPRGRRGQHPAHGSVLLCGGGAVVYLQPATWMAGVHHWPGHAVQRMDGALRWHDYEFDQCSSTALDMAYRVARADIIVNSADAVTEDVLGAVPASAIVIDISGSMEPLRDLVADYVPRAYVGSWNIAKLLRRVRVRIEKESETDG